MALKRKSGRKPLPAPVPAPFMPTLDFQALPAGEYKEVGQDFLEVVTNEGWRIVCPVPTVEEGDKASRVAVSRLLDIMQWELRNQRHSAASMGGPLFIPDLSRLLGEEDMAELAPVSRVVKMRYLVWRPLSGDAMADLGRVKDNALKALAEAREAVKAATAEVTKATQDVTAKDAEIAKLKKDLESARATSSSNGAAYQTEKKARELLAEGVGRLWRYFGEDKMKRVLGPTAQNPVPVTVEEQRTAHERLLSDSD